MCALCWYWFSNRERQLFTANWGPSGHYVCHCGFTDCFYIRCGVKIFLQVEVQVCMHTCSACFKNSMFYPCTNQSEVHFICSKIPFLCTNRAKCVGKLWSIWDNIKYKVIIIYLDHPVHLWCFFLVIRSP